MRGWAIWVASLCTVLFAGLSEASASFDCNSISGRKFLVPRFSHDNFSIDVPAGTVINFRVRADLLGGQAIIKIDGRLDGGPFQEILDDQVNLSRDVNYTAPAAGTYNFQFQQLGGNSQFTIEATCLSGAMLTESLQAAQRKAISQGVGAYLHNRASLLLSSDPDRTRITRRLAGATGSLASEDNSAQPRFRKRADMTFGPGGYSASALLSSSSEGLRVWSEGYLSAFSEDLTAGLSRDGDFQVVYAGGDVLFLPNLMLGLLGQFDWFDEKGLLGDVKAQGWMIGPYIGILISPVWQFDARAAWGQSQNDVDLVGSFNGSQWLARGSLRGNWLSGPWRFTSIAELAYVGQEQEQFRAFAATAIPGQTVTLGRFTFGPELAYRIERNGSFVEPQISLQGLWNFDQEGEIDLQGFVSRPDDFFGRVEGGLMFGRTGGGLTFRAIGAYEGIGTSDFEVWSARIWGSIPLN